MSDLTLLSKISNEAINENLKLRFDHGEIYVRHLLLGGSGIAALCALDWDQGLTAYHDRPISDTSWCLSTPFETVRQSTLASVSVKFVY